MKFMSRLDVVLSPGSCLLLPSLPGRIPLLRHLSIVPATFVGLRVSAYMNRPLRHIRQCCNLQSVVVNRVVKISSDVLREMLPESLQQLGLSHCETTDAALLANGLPRTGYLLSLRCLYITEPASDSTRLFICRTTRWPRLEELHLRNIDLAGLID